MDVSTDTPPEPAEIEAAAWYARLGERRVTTQTIEDFFAWRAVPANAEAYRRVETVWAETGKISGSQAVADAIGAAMTRKGRGGGRQRRRRQPRFLIGLGAVAAAVALVVAVGIWRGPSTRPTSENSAWCSWPTVRRSGSTPVPGSASGLQPISVSLSWRAAKPYSPSPMTLSAPSSSRQGIRGCTRSARSSMSVGKAPTCW